MILLICGGRGFNDYEKLAVAMRALPFTPSIIVEGGARGADSLARGWAVANKVHYAEVPALWGCFDKAAGGLRNSAMLLLRPEYCVALPGGSGTRNMVDQCTRAGIPVWEPYK